MEVEVVHLEGCPHVALARGRVLEAAQRTGVAAVVRERVVVGEADAAAAGMRGSPTVLVAGVDVVAGGSDSLSCRLYDRGDGYDGAPSVDDIAAALARAAEGGTRAGPDRP